MDTVGGEERVDAGHAPSHYNCSSKYGCACESPWIQVRSAVERRHPDPTPGFPKLQIESERVKRMEGKCREQAKSGILRTVDADS